MDFKLGLLLLPTNSIPIDIELKKNKISVLEEMAEDILSNSFAYCINKSTLKFSTHEF